MSQTICRVIVNGLTVEEIENFSYQSDALAIAEEANFTVSNKRKIYRDQLRIGQSVEFILENRDVNGGTPTVKHRGVIVRRNPKYSSQNGMEIAITSADKGWHLQNCCAPLWMRLQGKTYESICDPSVSPFFDKSWDFKGVRFDGNIKRQLKLGVAAVAAAAQRVLDPVHVIQVEAGEVPADKIAEYARRLNLLLNVSPDGYVCLYRPNYDQEPLYAFRCRDNDALNNIISAEVMEDARTLWDEVIVVGEQIGYEGSVDSQNPNATKKRGRVVHEGILPFKNRKTAADGEMYQNGLAQKQAEWMYKKGIFEAFYINYTVSEHHQNGYWYEANTMAHIDDDELGLTGNYWVQSVRCTGSKQGADETVVTLRKPGLLSAAFGEIPAPPIYYASGITGAPHAAP